MDQKGLYRKKALERLSTPEQLDNMLTITSLRSWIAVAGAALIVVSLLAWGFWGNVTTRVPGAGILMRPGGIIRVVSSTGGRVVSVRVARGEQVTPDQPVVEVETMDGTVTQVRSHHHGRVLEPFIREGDQVSTGSPLLIMEAGREDDPAAMEAILFVPADMGQRIKPGMEAYIAPVIANQGEYGMLVGQIKSVAEFPATFEGAVSTLGNQELVSALVGRTLSVEVRVELLSDDTTPSGYRWTIGQGPEISLQGGTICQGSIILQRERPIALLFPFLGRETR